MSDDVKKRCGIMGCILLLIVPFMYVLTNIDNLTTLKCNIYVVLFFLAALIASRYAYLKVPAEILMITGGISGISAVIFTIFYMLR